MIKDILHTDSDLIDLKKIPVLEEENRRKDLEEKILTPLDVDFFNAFIKELDDEKGDFIIEIDEKENLNSSKE